MAVLLALGVGLVYNIYYMKVIRRKSGLCTLGCCVGGGCSYGVGCSVGVSKGLRRK